MSPGEPSHLYAPCYHRYELHLSPLCPCKSLISRRLDFVHFVLPALPIEYETRNTYSKKPLI